MRANNKVCATPSGADYELPVPAVDRREDCWRQSHQRRVSLRSGVSCDTGLLAQVAVEWAEQGIAIAIRPIGKVHNKILNLLASGFAKTLNAAEVGCVGLDQRGVELMLADDLAKTVTNGAAAEVSISVLV